MGILLSLHEQTAGPLKRVFEVCLKAMEDVPGEIKSVIELPQIPFTKPIIRKIEAGLEALEPGTEIETESPEIANKRRRRTKRSKKSIAASESSTSTTNSKQKRQKRSKKASKGYMDKSTSLSSSVSSLPDTSRNRMKCSLCNLWIEKYEMRQHERDHRINDNTSPSVTKSVRPSRQAKKNSHQMPEFEYY